MTDRSDAQRWLYGTTRTLTHVRSLVVNTELDALHQMPSGTIETYGADRHDIPFGFEVNTDGTKSVGRLIPISAKQAEVVAVNLLEQGHAARRGRDVYQ